MKSREQFEIELNTFKSEFTSKIDERLGSMTKIQHKDGKPVCKPSVTPSTKPELFKTKSELQKYISEDNARRNPDYVPIAGHSKLDIITTDNVHTTNLKKVYASVQSVAADSKSLDQLLFILNIQKGLFRYDYVDVAGKIPGKNLQLVLEQIKKVESLLQSVKQLEAQEAKKVKDAKTQARLFSSQSVVKGKEAEAKTKVQPR